MRGVGVEQDPQLEASIKSMEVAYRMQTEAPEVFDVRKESQATLDLYGPGHVARGALMAVRLAEKGVRMTQVYYAKGDPWDAHGDIMAHKVNAKNSDQAFAAVIKDLKQRGLWKDTLVVCGSEFGRTPVREVGGGGGNVKRGRDHNPFGFTMWLAGGAVKGGTIYGATDDFGFQGCGEARARSRHSRDDPVLARDRSHEAHVPLQRTRLPAHGCPWKRAARLDRIDPVLQFSASSHRTPTSFENNLDHLDHPVFLGKGTVMIRPTILLVVAAVRLAAQTSGIQGTVSDTQGAVVPQAVVSLTNQETSAARRTITADTGNFTFVQVTPGSYLLEVQVPGFRSYSQA